MRLVITANDSYNTIHACTIDPVSTITCTINPVFKGHSDEKGTMCTVNLCYRYSLRKDNHYTVEPYSRDGHSDEMTCCYSETCLIETMLMNNNRHYSKTCLH